MTTPIDILFNRPVFTELIINILYFVIAYSIPHNIGDFYRLLLKLPYQTVEDIEIYSYHLYRIEQLSGDSEIYSLLCSRLRRIGYNMLDCLRNSDDVDLVEILHRITLALCSISLDKETIRLLITIMYEGHYDISRIIFYRLSTIDWINEVDIIGLDRRILIDRLEDALYGNTELLSKLYEYRDNNIVKAEIVVEVDPISGEHLGNDKVQLPDTHIILNRSTLEMWFEYAGCIDPYTRKPLSWDDIKTVI
jgi:hypothetical protein